MNVSNEFELQRLQNQELDIVFKFIKDVASSLEWQDVIFIANSRNGR